MTVAAKWLRRFEITLLMAGVSLLGGAFAATVWRWDYQARQERAFTQLEHQKSEVESPRNDDWVSAREVPFRADARRVPYVDPLALARIEIPRVGVKAIVREGVDTATLAIAVGHIGGTAQPGENGRVVLAGHRDTFFRGLRNIRLDDRVKLDVPPDSYEYRVVSLEVVAPGETRVLDPTGGQELTLVTCHPFGFIGRAPNRFIVHAVRIE